MYVAIDSNKERIQIENASNDKEYFCPICGEKLIIKAIDSKSVRTHFAHKSKKDCDDFSHDMRDWHYNWQVSSTIILEASYQQYYVESVIIFYFSFLLLLLIY